MRRRSGTCIPLVAILLRTSWAPRGQDPAATLPGALLGKDDANTFMYHTVGGSKLCARLQRDGAAAASQRVDTSSLYPYIYEHDGQCVPNGHMPMYMCSTAVWSLDLWLRGKVLTSVDSRGDCPHSTRPRALSPKGKFEGTILKLV